MTIAEIGNANVMGGVMARAGYVACAASAALIMDGNTEKIAVKFWPSSTDQITDVDMYVSYTGDCTGTMLILSVQSDSGDAPDGVDLAATAEFAGLNGVAGWCGGGTNPIDLVGAGTGALTVGKPYWLVIYYSSGTSLDSSHKITASGLASGAIILPMRAKLYDGATWTTASNQRYAFICKAGGIVYGLPFAVTAARSTATDIFDSNKQGVTLTVGSQMLLLGVLVTVNKAGNPAGTLNVAVYKADGTQLGSTTSVAAADIVTLITIFVWFSTAITIPADTAVTITLWQGNGTTDGDDSNDYDLIQMTVPANYIGAALPATMRFVYGTATPPTTTDKGTTEVPCLFPVFVDPSTDFDSVGGSLIINPGLSGGLR